MEIKSSLFVCDMPKCKSEHEHDGMTTLPRGWSAPNALLLNMNNLSLQLSNHYQKHFCPKCTRKIRKMYGDLLEENGEHSDMASSFEQVRLNNFKGLDRITLKDMFTNKASNKELAEMARSLGMRPELWKTDTFRRSAVSKIVQAMELIQRRRRN